MNDLLIGLLSVALATNQPAALSNLVTRTTGISVTVPNANDPVEQQLRQIMEDDDAAVDEVDRWIQENESFKAQGAGVDAETLNHRIRTRLQKVRDAYEDFLKQQPRHAAAHLAYASFLNDIHEEEQSLPLILKSRDLDPSNPAAWNNLANYYGHYGPVTNAFTGYTKAIELDPQQSVYYQNFATTMFLFRKDAREFYGIDEQEVFNRSLKLYHQALERNSTSFLVATDLAQTYYGIKPDRWDDAIKAWDVAMSLARTEEDRQGVHLHLARNQINAGRFSEARRHLDAVKLTELQELKRRLQRKLTETETKPMTNSPAPPVPSAP